ncbi:MAG: sulfite exporter TauE/SafE family protein [Gemmatimonadaceae bacterium]
MPTAARLTAVAAAAALGGGMNAIAGGGTLLTFPALIALGIPPLVANATSTVALWPGSLGSMLGYRRELEGVRAWATRFAIPSIAGGVVGAFLLLRTPADRFKVIVPWLVLGATVLFMIQEPLSRWVRRQGSSTHPPEAVDPARSVPATSFLVYQAFVGIYGGYFGAGAGILMLGALQFMGLRNIHQMNGLKNWGGVCMNGFAAMAFAASGIVNWSVALAMAVGATAGGFGASRIAQRVPQRVVRWMISAIGLGAGLWMLAGRM